MMRQHTRALGWSLALLLVGAFSALGHWQWTRMADKQARLAQAGQARTTTLSYAQALAAPGRLHHVQVEGRLQAPVLLLDNQLRDGRAGARAYQVLLPDGQGPALLVDLGWLPVPGNRQLPAPQPLRGRFALRGLLAPPPSVGLALGAALPVAAAADGAPWLLTRIDIPALQDALPLAGRRLHGHVLRLDPDLPLGFARDLELLPNTLPPSRHLGYAVQWYALAAAVLVIAVVLEWRLRRRRGKAAAACQNGQYE